MKAIFIDAVNRKVEDVQVKNELHAFYDRIGCDMIEVISLGGGFLLICDEEGRCKEMKTGFRLLDGEGIAGNGLIVCDNGDGDFTDCPMPAGLVEELVTFLDLEKTPLPPPAFGYAPIADFTPESIAKARKEALECLRKSRISSVK